MNNKQPSYDSPVHSDVEAKLRRFLVELQNVNKILGIQVCAYKDGKVIIDTACGVLGIDDPRPVQPDTLFPIFSTSKGITAGMVHWLADKGKFKLDDYVANIWPEFGSNGKEQIKVSHILHHSAGLHNALAGISEEDDPTSFCDFDECLKRIAEVSPEAEPGSVELYHYLSYGWLCGGIIEKASGKKFQEILEEAFVRPLNIEGEFYIGIPPGVESRLATVTMDADELNLMAHLINSGVVTFMPSTFNVASNLIPLSNNLNVRRAIIPAANAHVSARALARYYATLLDGGVVPPKNSGDADTRIFENNSKEKLHDAFLGRGDYKDLVSPDWMFGLGFTRVKNTDGSIIGFGHGGLGGSIGYCDINNKFAISLTLNKLTMGSLTAEILNFICSELDLPVPKGYDGPVEKPVIT